MILYTLTKIRFWEFTLFMILTGALASPSSGFADCQIPVKPWESNESISCIEVLINPSSHGREKTYRALKSIENNWQEDALPYIVELTKHKEPDFQRMALKTFENVQKFSKNHRETLVTSAIEALTAPNSEVRVTAAKTLKELGSSTAEKALIKAAKEDTSASVIAWAASALGSMKLKTTPTQRLINILESVSNILPIPVQAKSERIKSKNAPTQVLLDLLKSTQFEIRYSAVRALGEINNPEFMKYLPPLLNDPSIPVRMATCESLGNSGNKSFYRSVANQARSSDLNISILCTIAATKLDTKRSFPFLVKLLNNENREIRLQAVYLMGGIPSKHVARLLGKTLMSDKDAGIRYTAASLLGGMVFEDSFRFLEKSINDPSIYVLSYSVKALQNLGKRAESFYDPEKREYFIQRTKNILAKFSKHKEGIIQCKASIELADLDTYENLESLTTKKLDLCNPQDKCRAIWLLIEKNHPKGSTWAFKNREWIQTPSNCPNLGSKILANINRVSIKNQ